MFHSLSNSNFFLKFSLFKNIHLEPDVGGNAFNPNIQKAESGRYFWVQGHSALQSEFQDSQS